jgi:hypothetical protein
MRRVVALVVCAALAVVGFAAGCGGTFKMPTETPKTEFPTDKSYQLQAVWSGQIGIKDLLLIQGNAPQLFLLTNTGGSTTAPRGDIVSVGRFRPTGQPPPISDIHFLTLFNPVALCSGGDGVSGRKNRIYVLDAGDTCIARTNSSGSCEATRVVDYAHYWRVREFGLLAGDTISSFSDTTVASVQGVAADETGRVYVSCLAIILKSDPLNPSIRTRLFEWRIYRYLRGSRYPGIFPPDPRMPGSNWYRDTTWEVRQPEGAGSGFVDDPRGIDWSPYALGAVYAADHGLDRVQRLSDRQSSTALLSPIDGPPFLRLSGPEDVAVDLEGFVYVVDANNRRVVRFDPLGFYVQRVDIEPDSSSLEQPTCVAADDSLVYVGDAGAGIVVRYKRR